MVGVLAGQPQPLTTVVKGHDEGCHSTRMLQANPA
jgi:hypothetical protein